MLRTTARWWWVKKTTTTTTTATKRVVPRKQWSQHRTGYCSSVVAMFGSCSPTRVTPVLANGRKRGGGTNPNSAAFASAARQSMPPIRSEKEGVSSRHYDVIVVGAGWAGLAAVDRLAQAGLGNTTVLEARDYIGGRTRTVRLPQLLPVPVELGAEWVYADTSVHRILDRLQVPYGVTEYQFQHGHTALYRDRVFREGVGTTKLTPQEIETLVDKNWYGPQGFLQFARNRSKLLLRSGDKDTNFDQLMRDYFSQTLEFFTPLDRQLVLALAQSEIANEFAAPLHQASVKEIASRSLGEEESWSMSYMGVPGGGYDRLITSLAEPYFRKHIQLQSTVTAIQYGMATGELAQVTYTDQITGSVITTTALAVLVTVPLGVLQAGDIVFSPPLPQSKQNAIQAVGFGTLNKCILYWHDDTVVNAARQWWPDGHTWLNLIAATEGTAGAWTTFFNPVSANGGTHILTGFVAGDDADAMVQQTDDQVVAKVLTNLRTMLGDDVPEPTQTLVTRWNQDEFAKGSYSFPSADCAAGRFVSDEAARVELGRPVGSNLFFAGEATDVEMYATTAGAYDSGIRAGDEIIARLMI